MVCYLSVVERQTEVRTRTVEGRSSKSTKINIMIITIELNDYIRNDNSILRARIDKNSSHCADRCSPVVFCNIEDVQVDMDLDSLYHTVVN